MLKISYFCSSKTPVQKYRSIKPWNKPNKKFIVEYSDSNAHTLNRWKNWTDLDLYFTKIKPTYMPR